jgi:hypothetical protein
MTSRCTRGRCRLIMWSHFRMRGVPAPKQWDRAKRVQFANDQARNLLAVDGKANAGKGDSGPGEWLPVNQGFRCKYARDWAQVLYAYRLHVAPDGL